MVNREKEFQLNVQRAILLSLVNRGLLTRSQFEQCMERLSANKRVEKEERGE